MLKYLNDKNKLIETEIFLNKANLRINNYYLFPANGYRMRCEFSFKDSKYIMFDRGKSIEIKSFTKAHPLIQNSMSELSKFLQTHVSLTKGLFQLNFRTNGNETLISFIYRKNIPENFLVLIEQLENNDFIRCLARAKGKLLSLTNNVITSEVSCGSTNYSLQHSDNSFYQPNFYSLTCMLNFINQHLTDCEDLLELYCGCGSFTIPLSQYFKNVFASDSNRDNINNLKINLSTNKISNVKLARISDDEFSRALNGKEFKRLQNINIDSFNFSHVLVDPPRSGLTHSLAESLKRYKNIIYVSCNPKTFLRDLDALDHHKVKDLAVFDQFSNTDHLELIALLGK